MIFERSGSQEAWLPGVEGPEPGTFSVINSRLCCFSGREKTRLVLLAAIGAVRDAFFKCRPRKGGEPSSLADSGGGALAHQKGAYTSGIQPFYASLEGEKRSIAERKSVQPPKGLTPTLNSAPGNQKKGGTGYSEVNLPLLAGLLSKDLALWPKAQCGGAGLEALHSQHPPHGNNLPASSKKRPAFLIRGGCRSIPARQPASERPASAIYMWFPLSRVRCGIGKVLSREGGKSVPSCGVPGILGNPPPAQPT
jgi:hypothetical protein